MGSDVFLNCFALEDLIIRATPEQATGLFALVGSITEAVRALFWPVGEAAPRAGPVSYTHLKGHPQAAQPQVPGPAERPYRVIFSTMQTAAVENGSRFSVSGLSRIHISPRTRWRLSSTATPGGSSKKTSK